MTTTHPKPLTPAEAKKRFPLQLRQAYVETERRAYAADHVCYTVWRDGMFQAVDQCAAGERWFGRFDKGGKL